MSMPTKPPAASGVCDWCRELCDELKYCAKCKVARYCSVMCQKKHWGKHHSVCKASPISNSVEPIELVSFLKDIAFQFAMQEPDDLLPANLCSPIIRKKKRNESEVLIFLGQPVTKPIEPKLYDLTVMAGQDSANSWLRMCGIGFGSIINRAAALAINSALLLDNLKLHIDGRPVTSLALYKCEPKIPLWICILPQDGVTGGFDEEDDENQICDPQDKEHLWIGFKVKPANKASVTEEVYFVDFNGISLGIFDSVDYEGSKLFLVHGWSADLRHASPNVYRSGSIYRAQDYMDRWSQLWPELKQRSETETTSGPNINNEHKILAEKVSRVECAIKRRKT
jgi:hypothetical protein